METPSLRSGHIFSELVSHLLHVNEPAVKGHLSCRDTLYGISEVSTEDRFNCGILSQIASTVYQNMAMVV